MRRELGGKEGIKSGENIQLPSAGTQLRASLANVNMANLKFHITISPAFSTGVALKRREIQRVDSMGGMG